MTQFENGAIVRHSPLGHTELTVNTSVVTLPALPTLTRLRRILITPRNAGIIWTDDGSTPTASHGQPLTQDSTLVYDGDTPDVIKMVRDGATNADVRIAYYGL